MDSGTRTIRVRTSDGKLALLASAQVRESGKYAVARRAADGTFVLHEVTRPFLIATGIAGGWDHSLALKTGGSIVGWGADNYGQATPPRAYAIRARTADGKHALVAPVPPTYEPSPEPEPGDPCIYCDDPTPAEMMVELSGYTGDHEQLNGIYVLVQNASLPCEWEHVELFADGTDMELIYWRDSDTEGVLILDLRGTHVGEADYESASLTKNCAQFAELPNTHVSGDLSGQSPDAAAINA